VNGRGDKDWVDPYVGFNATLPLGEKLELVLRGDVGGFDVGAKLAWQAVVRLTWNSGETFFATLATAFSIPTTRTARARAISSTT
jgi:hypothetical protein